MSPRPSIQVVSPAAAATNPYSRLTAADEVIDTNISRLRIQSTLARAGIYVDVTDTVTTGSVIDIADGYEVVRLTNPAAAFAW